MGPSGSPVCLELPGYTGYQWATCLRDSYIRSKSSGLHRCVDTLANYCYYQCEVELNGKNNGIVNSNCRCTPGATPPPTTAPLPPWCMDPSGDKCSWYRECLEKVHPCQNHEASYAIIYGEKFCKLYEDNHTKFSVIGQKWINNVRRCLQLQLVPYIRDFQRQAKCEEIKKAAFKSHDCCYLAGDECPKQTGAPSVCDIPAKDWANIIWTIKGSLGDEFLNTMRSALKVGSNCLVDALDKSKDRIISLYFDIIGNAREFLDSKIKELGIEISKQLKEKWFDKTYDWLYYLKDQPRIRRNVSLYLFLNLCCKNNFNPLLSSLRKTSFIFLNIIIQTGKDRNNNSLEIVLWIRSRNTDQNLNNTVNRIMSSIQTSYFAKSFNDGSMVQLKTASSCQDLKCDDKTKTVFAKAQRSSSETLFHVNVVLIGLAFLAAYVIASNY